MSAICWTRADRTARPTPRFVSEAEVEGLERGLVGSRVASGTCALPVEAEVDVANEGTKQVAGEGGAILAE
jgi:hypothetical protein